MLRRVAADRGSHVPLAGTVERCLRTDLVQGDHQKQFPQFLTLGDVIMPSYRPTEKSAEDRLHDVFWIDSYLEVSGTKSPICTTSPRPCDSS